MAVDHSLLLFMCAEGGTCGRSQLTEVHTRTQWLLLTVTTHSDGSPENRRPQKAVENPDLLESLWVILQTKQPYRVNFSNKTCLLFCQVHRWPHGKEWRAAPSIVRGPGQGRNNLLPEGKCP